jgi:hypothetical protein
MSATLKVIDGTITPEPSQSTAAPGASSGMKMSLPTQTASISWVVATTTTPADSASSAITMTTPPALSVSSVTTEVVTPTSESDSDHSQKLAVTVAVWFFVAATGIGVVFGTISCIAFAKHRSRDGPWVLMF